MPKADRQEPHPWCLSGQRPEGSEDPAPAMTPDAEDDHPSREGYLSRDATASPIRGWGQPPTDESCRSGGSVWLEIEEGQR